MKRAAVAVVIVVAAASLAPASEAVKGTVIDTACYLAGKHGAEEKGCTEMCINGGVPASLLTEDGEVLLLLPAPGNMQVLGEIKKAATKVVEVTGKIIDRGGMKALAVESLKVTG